jgi:alkanesulfonate monooxygenase SsuD/methylene tetrahydromethanopterin reductase-like flavin-dependent oxidoreductase (luciferase family)
MTVYLNTENYRNNLARVGWSEADLEPPGSDALFDEIVAWGGPDQVAKRMRSLYEAGADQVVLNLVTAQPRLPYLEELRALAALVAQPSA